jgi:hypothetical protein
MKAYFAGQCGGLLGGIAGAVVGSAINHVRYGSDVDHVFESNPQREKDKQDTMLACSLVGFAIGGLAGVYMASK